MAPTAEMAKKLLVAIERNARRNALDTILYFGVSSKVMAGKTFSQIREECLAMNESGKETLWSKAIADNCTALRSEGEIESEILEAIQSGMLLSCDCLQKETKEVVIETQERPPVNLGFFLLKYHLLNASITVTESRKNRPYDGYIHPHVSLGGNLCAGNIKRLFWLLCNNGFIIDSVLLAEQVLHGYGNGSPFVPITAFINAKCDSCIRIRATFDLFRCKHCLSNSCGSCGRQVSGVGWVCYKCASY